VFSLDQLADIFGMIALKETRMTSKYQSMDIRQALDEKQQRLYDVVVEKMGEPIEIHVVIRLFYIFRDLALTLFKHTNASYKDLS
jgi:hypothetical protein